ncbi:MAG: hypothetical protein ACOXZV_06855 [Bacteroidales bacterium]
MNLYIFSYFDMMAIPGQSMKHALYRIQKAEGVLLFLTPEVSSFNSPGAAPGRWCPHNRHNPGGVDFQLTIQIPVLIEFFRPLRTTG